MTAHQYRRVRLNSLILFGVISANGCCSSASMSHLLVLTPHLTICRLIQRTSTTKKASISLHSHLNRSHPHHHHLSTLEPHHHNHYTTQHSNQGGDRIKQTANIPPCPAQTPTMTSSKHSQIHSEQTMMPRTTYTSQMTGSG